MIDLSKIQIRQLIQDELNTDALFNAFAEEHFGDVYERFDQSMDRSQRLNQLVNQKDARPLVVALLEHAVGKGTPSTRLKEIVGQLDEILTQAEDDLQQTLRGLKQKVEDLTASEAKLKEQVTSLSSTKDDLATQSDSLKVKEVTLLQQVQVLKQQRVYLSLAVVIAGLLMTLIGLGIGRVMGR